MQSPRLFSVRVNSEDADLYSNGPVDDGADSHGKHGDEHRTHTSVWSFNHLRIDRTSGRLLFNKASRTKQSSCIQTDEPG